MKKNKSEDITAVAVNNTIQIFFGEKYVNIQKDSNEKVFDHVMSLIKANNLKQLKLEFDDIRKQIEGYTHGNFTEKDGYLYLKGDGEPIPKVLSKKLIEFKNKEEDFMPLVRFWKKLKKNPDTNVREQLYGFLSHNNIAISPLGDVICEKGVKEDSNGNLLDQHSGKFDNSIGAVVSVPREDVTVDPNKTCAAGLHVGAPDYVRNHWSSGIIIEVAVDPADFVSIPTDYNQTKARVCRYQVIGLAKKDGSRGLVHKFEDIIDVPTHEVVKDQKNRHNFSGSNAAASEIVDASKVDFSKMTARKIISYIYMVYKVQITTNPSNKQQVIKEANKIMSEEQPLEVGEYLFNPNSGLKITAEQIKDYVSRVLLYYDVKPSAKFYRLNEMDSRNKQQVIKKAKELLNEIYSSIV